MLSALIESRRWNVRVALALALTPPATAGYDGPYYGITMSWHEGGAALVIGTLRLDKPADRDAQTFAQYSVEVESVVFGDLEAGGVSPLKRAVVQGLIGGVVPLPIDEKALLVLDRDWTSPPKDGGPEWSITRNGYDFMPDGLPFCPVGSEADAVLRDAPRMIEIAGLGYGKPVDREALKREAVWEEWRKGEMRRTLLLGWICDLHRDGPAGRVALLDFFSDLVNDRTMPPDCRLLTDSYLASPYTNHADYAADTPARAALLIELLAHPDLPEHNRQSAERTLAELTKRLEAEKKAEAPGKGSPDAQRPD